MVKHTSLREIEAAINSLLRRIQEPSHRTKPSPPRPWVLHRPSWSLIAPDLSAVKLTATEVAFLTVLMNTINETCLRDDLVHAMARRYTTFDNRHLDAVVSRLRRKIAKSTDLPSPIKVIYGTGYAFTSPGRID
ncbi:winged helix-turn-helix domain-containing protein [Azospirillum lipoferum]|uniref:winged helix-turn-helix domain-containing protein n=1 Tax=Azospirillum lipoferum TaxID=193 RepID=UPI00139601FB|nr:winged helix-turn-helix domain-containing protein [Azospirillum lipoferum]